MSHAYNTELVDLLRMTSERLSLFTNEQVTPGKVLSIFLFYSEVSSWKAKITELFQMEINFKQFKTN